MLGVRTCPAFDRSRSARSAARGSEAIAAIEPSRGPNPNRCNANAASFGSQAIGLVPPRSALHIICRYPRLHHPALVPCPPPPPPSGPSPSPPLRGGGGLWGFSSP